MKREELKQGDFVAFQSGSRVLEGIVNFAGEIDASISINPVTSYIVSYENILYKTKSPKTPPKKGQSMISKKNPLEKGNLVKFCVAPGLAAITGKITAISGNRLTIQSVATRAYYDVPHDYVLFKVSNTPWDKSPFNPQTKSGALPDIDNDLLGIPDYPEAVKDAVKILQASLSESMINIALDTGNKELFMTWSKGVGV